MLNVRPYFRPTFQTCNAPIARIRWTLVASVIASLQLVGLTIMAYLYNAVQYQVMVWCLPLNDAGAPCSRWMRLFLNQKIFLCLLFLCVFFFFFFLFGFCFVLFWFALLFFACVFSSPVGARMRRQKAGSKHCHLLANSCFSLVWRNEILLKIHV